MIVQLDKQRINEDAIAIDTTETTLLKKLSIVSQSQHPGQKTFQEIYLTEERYNSLVNLNKQ